MLGVGCSAATHERCLALVVQEVVPFSILDLVPVPGSDSRQAMRNSLELAELADELGYRRLWYAEHHNMPIIASTTPEIMIALAAERTARIRLGSGGVMLPNHAPLKVAETFKMLESLYRGRIDLGIGRAPGTDPATALALRGSRDALGAGGFPAQLKELLEYGGIPEMAEMFDVESNYSPTVKAVPEDVKLPPIWLLGSSDFGAQLAAALGTGFGFAAHFSDYPPELPMRLYRDRFMKGQLERPHAILTLSVICAPTDEEAQRLASSLLVAFARLRTGQSSMMLPPEEALRYEFSPAERTVVDEIKGRHIAGSRETVKRRVDELVRRTAADEVMLSTFIYGHEERLRSFRLVAEAFQLQQRELQPAS